MGAWYKSVRRWIFTGYPIYTTPYLSSADASDGYVCGVYSIAKVKIPSSNYNLETLTRNSLYLAK